MTGWIATFGQIVGNLDNWETVWHWDRKFHPTRRAAITAGFETFGSDDFNVAQVDDGRVVWFGWMDEKHPDEDYPEVAAQLGLAVQ